jgi:hypothetical protein
LQRILECAARLSPVTAMSLDHPSDAKGIDQIEIDTGRGRPLYSRLNQSFGPLTVVCLKIGPRQDG